MSALERGILDTNAVILLADLVPDELPEAPVITAITLAELSVGPLVAAEPSEAARRQSILQQVEASFDPIPFDADAARAYGRAAADLRRAGRKASARAFDVLIAATAIAHGLRLYTANPSDFRGIESLDLRPLTHPDHRAGAGD